MQLPSALSSGLSPQKFSLKEFFIFLFKKTCSEKFSYIFSKTTFPILRKRNFLIFRKRYIQNPGTFRTLSNIYDGTFCKNSYLEHFSIQAQETEKVHPKKISYTPEKWNFLTLTLKNFLCFLKRKLLFDLGSLI